MNRHALHFSFTPLVRADMSKGNRRKGNQQETKTRFSVTVLLSSILPQLQHCHLARAEVGQQRPLLPMRKGALSHACFSWSLPTVWGLLLYFVGISHSTVLQHSVSYLSQGLLLLLPEPECPQHSSQPSGSQTLLPGCSWVIAATEIQCSQRSNQSVHSSFLSWAKDLLRYTVLSISVDPKA